jgi:FKBP-type peptidyl-prolyl cis-trans isomerase FklB
MREGEKWEVAIPSELAYGCKGKGDKIKSDQVLVFEIELLKIK